MTKYIHRQWWIHIVRRLYGFLRVADEVSWVAIAVDDDNDDVEAAVVVYFVVVVVIVLSSSIFSIIFLFCYWKGNTVVFVVVRRRRYSFRFNQCTSFFPHKCLSRSTNNAWHEVEEYTLLYTNGQMHGDTYARTILRPRSVIYAVLPSQDLYVRGLARFSSRLLCFITIIITITIMCGSFCNYFACAWHNFRSFLSGDYCFAR